MPQKSQWSISRIFLWVFIAALIASHLANFYQRQIVGFTNFSLDGNAVQEWVVELDPTTKCYSSGEGASNSGDSVDSDLDYVFTSENSTSEQILDRLRLKIDQQLKSQNWLIRGYSTGDDSFSFHVHNRDTRFRIYGWLVPNTEGSFASQLEEQGDTVTNIKILRGGYLAR